MTTSDVVSWVEALGGFSALGIKLVAAARRRHISTASLYLCGFLASVGLTGLLFLSSVAEFLPFAFVATARRLTQLSCAFFIAMSISHVVADEAHTPQAVRLRRLLFVTGVLFFIVCGVASINLPVRVEGESNLVIGIAAVYMVIAFAVSAANLWRFGGIVRPESASSVATRPRR